MRTIAIPRIVLRYKLCKVKGSRPPKPIGLAEACANEKEEKVDRVMVDEDYTFYSYGSTPYQKVKVRDRHGYRYEDYSDI